MLVKSWLEPLGKYVCDETINDQYQLSSPVIQKKIIIEDAFVKKLISRQTITSGLFMIDTFMEFKGNVRDHFEITGENIVLIFHIKGKATGNIKGFMEPVDFIGNMNNIMYTPGLTSIIDMDNNLQYNYFCIVLSTDFYFKLLHESLALHKDFIKKVVNKIQTFLSGHSLKTTHHMKQVIHDIRNCRKNGELKRVYLETKVRELLLLQFEQLQIKNQLRPYILKKEEEMKVQLAREILEADLQNAPNIKCLSRLVSLNEFKLKNGFKAQYGTTIHQYLIQLRMLKAKELLNSNKYTIGEIATIAGYKNPAHFSKAFKNFYDRLPSESLG